MRVIVGLLVGLAAVVTIISLIGPNIDLEIARLFFDPVTRRFPAGSNPYVATLRDHGYVSIITCVGFVAAALATKFWPKFRLNLPARVAVFLVGSLALGPGLLVNGVFKDYWHRPRPIQVTEFGGDKPYVNWWYPGGTCARNCSFASGEAASAAWMVGPAMLAPAPWRAAAIGAAAIFTAATSLSRMAVGAHFFTDVVFGALMSLLVLWAMYALIFNRVRSRPS